MNEEKQPETATRARWSAIIGRIAAALVLTILFYAVLWFVVFDAVTAALVASGMGVTLVVSSSASDVFAAVLDWIAEALAACLAAIGAVLAAIAGLFN